MDLGLSLATADGYAVSLAKWRPEYCIICQLRAALVWTCKNPHICGKEEDGDEKDKEEGEGEGREKEE